MRLRSAWSEQPAEVRFFLLLSAFGIAIGIVYWFVAYETAGTVLLIGFGLATGLIGLRLLLADRPRIPAADLDRPFLDESGRLPDETLAPFAVGLGVAVAATGLIFGVAPVLLGLLPLAWGASRWLSAARAELDAQVREDAPRARS
ncbi:MAG: hypothetical protein M3067_01560 [Chloroflexota bacterium]|nr:hypothetical protein [Chloroflexota bacterium]